MNIDKPKLVELLVEKTGMQPENVENQLDQLIERIISAAKRGKALEIKDLGLFYFDESGELKFDPAEELSTEISFKYAGMKPVELKPKRDSTLPPIDADENKEPEFSPVINTPSEELPEIEDTPEDDPFGIDETGYDDFDFLSDMEKEPQPDSEPEEKPIEEVKTKPVKKVPPKRKNNNGLIAVLAILLLIVLIGGTVWFMDSFSSSEETDVATTSDLPVLVPEELPVITEEDEENMEQLLGMEGQQTADTVPAPEQEQEIVVQQPVEETPSITPQPPAEDQPLYGLTGVVMEQANDGYSIVIHSFNTEDTARSTAALLSQDGYRALVNARTVGGSSTWRVSVGQFETLEQARQAAEQLPSPYNTQNFIHRIQIN